MLHVRLPLRLWLFIGRAHQPRLELISHQCAAGSWPALCQNPRRHHAEEGSGSLEKPNEAEAAILRHTQYPLISHWCSAAVASWSTRPDSADTAADMASRRCHDDCSQQGADKPAVVFIHKFHQVHTRSTLYQPGVVVSMNCDNLIKKRMFRLRDRCAHCALPRRHRTPADRDCRLRSAAPG